VAVLAGVSPDCYAQLERGQRAGASESVLDAIAIALHLDDAERAHLKALARNGKDNPSRRRVSAANFRHHALFSPAFADESARRPVNMARFCLLSPKAMTLFPKWKQAADTVFRTRWAAHDVQLHRSGTKQFNHPMVGDLTLATEVLDLADDDLTLTVYSADPGNSSEDGLALLASSAASLDSTEEHDPVVRGSND
jgi:hypothetical protein